VVKKCIYCGCGLADESVVDVCEKCGHDVWGPKMFKAIIGNMEDARVKGDLNQGSIYEGEPVSEN